MDPRSEVLLRQATLFDGDVLLAGLAADDLLGRLPNATGWTWHAGDHAQLQARFAERCHFGTHAPAHAAESAVLFLPKSRELSEYLLQTLAARLSGKTLYLVGEKRAGIERAAKQLQQYGTPRKLDSARHCQLWAVSVEHAPELPDLNTLAQRYSLELSDGELTVVTLPGVFAHGRLDRGSALLLEYLDNLPGGHMLDFGCGAGVLGAVLKRRYPNAQISMLDVDAFALASSALTLAANGLSAELIAGTGIESAPKGLNAIISNPPFHQGVHTHYEASEQLLKQAREHLAPRGQLRIVANSFLKYPPLIERHLGACQTLAEGAGFKIYSAVRD